MARVLRLVPVLLLATPACSRPPAASPTQPGSHEAPAAQGYAPPTTAVSPPPGGEGPAKLAPPATDGIDSGDYRNLAEAESDLEARRAELEGVFEDRPEEALGQDATACRRACYALASMSRAVAGVCELAGEDDRCRDARVLLARSEERVDGAGCRCS